jgi:hypothetical protein
VGTRVLTPRFGEGPTSAERIDRLERVVAELLAWKAEHEAKEADGEDGEPSPPLPSPPWVPIKKAAARVGRSESALRKVIKRRPDSVLRWWRYDRGRLYAHIDLLPWPPVRTRT